MWQLFSILLILAVRSAEIEFTYTTVRNMRQFDVEVSCTGIPITIEGTGKLFDTVTFPICISAGMYQDLRRRGALAPNWVWGDWVRPMTLTVGYNCVLQASGNPADRPSTTLLKCCWGPWCTPGRRELSSMPNGEHFCESDTMIRNEEHCKQSSCCHWNTWEAGEASFHGQGRCWSSIGTQTCNDIHVEMGLQECHDEPAWWYDSDGPFYSCHWYRQDRRRCEWYGNHYRNFGKTANEACCGCRHTHGRRNLEELEGEDIIPKRGFLYANEIASGFIVESSEMIAIEGVTSTANKCRGRSWWDHVSLDHPTLECSAGEAIGAFYKTSIQNEETWSVEQGYCCAIEASADCTWKNVDLSAETMTCDEGYVLSGFKMDDEGFLFSDVEEIKCCRL